MLALTNRNDQHEEVEVASIVAIGAVFVGSFAAIAYAYDPESSEEAKADFCQSLSDLSSTVMSYDGIDPLTATNDELDAAADDIEGAWDEVIDDAEDWANAYDNELTWRTTTSTGRSSRSQATTRSPKTWRRSRTS